MTKMILTVLAGYFTLPIGVLLCMLITGAGEIGSYYQIDATHYWAGFWMFLGTCAIGGAIIGLVSGA